jgi:hypothetical protein
MSPLADCAHINTSTANAIVVSIVIIKVETE